MASHTFSNPMTYRIQPLNVRLEIEYSLLPHNSSQQTPSGSFVKPVQTAHTPTSVAQGQY
jgi:hypothetical protein